MRKLRKDYGLVIRDHLWLQLALIRFGGWDASTEAFMIANAWQRRS